MKEAPREEGVHFRVLRPHLGLHRRAAARRLSCQRVEGLVVAQRDSAAYADALAKVIEDPQLELQMAAAARARFDRDFDIKVTEKRLHERIHGFLDAQD